MRFLLFLALTFGMASQQAFSAGIAYLVGNSNYKTIGKLDNPENDARLIQSKLNELNYQVRLFSNVDEKSFRGLVRTIAKESGAFDAAIIYYAGHAVQLEGENFLLPVDQEAPNTEEDVKLSSIKMADLLAAIKSPVKILIMDACRDNPLIQKNMNSRARGLVSRGLAPPPSSTSGTFVAYATDSGNVASDGSGRNSPFSLALAENLLNRESIDDIFARVTKRVLALTGGAQRPFKYASLEDRFCFYGDCGSPGANRDDTRKSKNEPVSEEKKVQKISLDPTAATYFQQWLTYAMGENVLYQIDPKSFSYDPETQLARAVQRVAYLNTGISSIFKRVEKYSINTEIVNCKENYFSFLSTSEFKTDGTLISTYTYGEQERQKFEIKPGSISEAGKKLLCGNLAASMNIVPGTTQQGLVPYGADQDGTYWWSERAKMKFDQSFVYAVLFRYKAPINNKVTAEKIVGKILVASGKCSEPRKAHILRQYYIDDSNKISGVTFEDTEIEVFPGSVGDNIYKVDCK